MLKIFQIHSDLVDKKYDLNLQHDVPSKTDSRSTIEFNNKIPRGFVKPTTDVILNKNKQFVQPAKT